MLFKTARGEPPLMNTASGQDQLRSLHVRLGAHLLPPRRNSEKARLLRSIHICGGRKRNISLLSCETLLTPISFMSRSISVLMLPSAFSTPGCPAAASA